MILNQSQADVVYSAMCSLNNVNCICGDLTLSEGLRVQWLKSVTIRDGLSVPARSIRTKKTLQWLTD